MTEQLPLHGIAVYNPGILSKDELKRYFVARQPLLDKLLDELRREKPKHVSQHRLIAGTRGMGKTTLLRRLAVGVMDDEALAQHWLPLNFPEEQYNVARLSDFWANCLDALGDTLEDMGEDDLLEELDECVDQLPTKEDARADTAKQALLSFADRLNKRLMLLVDNLDIVLDRLKDSHWAIREVLGHEPRLLLIGASSRVLEETFEYDAAFYDFFKVHELKGLSETEMSNVLKRLAEADSNDKVAQLIDAEPARIRTLHTLTGGNPRTAVLLYGVLAQGIDGDVRSDLERLLDQCTPLYKARFEELPAQAQKVVDAMAIHWDPLNAGQLAEKARLPVNTVSTQLTRLAQQGVVEKVPLRPGRKHGFQIAERFFNIWYLMRTSRRVRRRLVWLVQFLKVFYSQNELQQRASRHLRMEASQFGEDCVRDAEYAFSLAQAIDDPIMRSALETSGLQRLLSDRKLRNELSSLIDLEGGDAELKDRADRMAFMKDLPEKVLKARGEWPDGMAGERFAWLLSTSLDLSLIQKRRVVDELPVMNEGELSELNRVLERADKQTEQIAQLSIWFPAELRDAIAQGIMESLLDVEGAKVAAQILDAEALKDFAYAQEMFTNHLMDDMDAHELVDGLKNIGWSEYMDCHFAWRFYGMVFHREGLWEKAIKAYRNQLEITPEDEQTWGYLGEVLHEKGDLHEAIKAYRKQTELVPEHVTAWSDLGVVLFDSENIEAAVEAFHTQVSVAPEHKWAWHVMGIVLELMGKLDDAIEAYRKHLGLTSDDEEAWLRLGDALTQKGDLDDAISAYQSGMAVESKGSNHDALAWLLYEQENNLQDAIELAREAVKREPDNPNYLYTLATLFMSGDQWIEAQKEAKAFLSIVDDKWLVQAWDDVLQFFREAASKGHAAEAAQLLIDADKADQLRPLYIALKAIAEGPDQLTQVAPEVRQPAETLMKRLTQERVAVSEIKGCGY